MLIKTAFVCLGLRKAQLAFYEIGFKKVLPPPKDVDKLREEHVIPQS